MDGGKGPRKRTKAGSGKAKRAVKKRKVEKVEEDSDSASSEDGNQDSKMDAVPDRPLGVRLRERKGKRVAAAIEDSGDNSE